MRGSHIAIAAAIITATAAGGHSLHSQTPAATPGTQDTSKVTAGTYSVDPNHTQVLFAFDHMGFTNNLGLFAQTSGSLTFDPANPGKASVKISIPINSIGTGVPKFNEHLLSADFFEADKYPTATFESTSVNVDGKEAEITGNLTIKGITKEVTLDTRFTGAGANPMSKKETIGFAAETVIKRSEFGLGKYVPVIGDTIELKITAAFEK